MRILPLILVMLLASCRNDAPPPPSAEQTGQLDDAEAMLNDLAANAEGPADRSTGPSNSEQ